jgi:hypothetical protein
VTLGGNTNGPDRHRKSARWWFGPFVFQSATTEERAAGGSQSALPVQSTNTAIGACQAPAVWIAKDELVAVVGGIPEGRFDDVVQECCDLEWSVARLRACYFVTVQLTPEKRHFRVESAGRAVVNTSTLRPFALIWHLAGAI